MACHHGHHILVLRAPRSSMDYTFMATLIAVSVGLVMVTSALSYSLAAINSISRQATKLPSQIFASFLNHLLNFITFTVQSSLNLLKHSLTGFCRYVTQSVSGFLRTIEKWITEEIATLLSNLLRSAVSLLLDLSKTVISNSVRSVFYSLKKVPQKLSEDVAHHLEGVSSATSITSNPLASFASSFVDALKNQAAHLLKNGIASVCEIVLERLEKFIERIEELIKNWESKLANIKETVSAISSGVRFMRDLMLLASRQQ